MPPLIALVRRLRNWKIVGEVSVYFVPTEQDRLAGTAQQAAESFWALGIFVVSPEFVYERIREWRKRGRTFPEWGHSFTFAEMGIVDGDEYEPVPNVIYDLRCSVCNHDLTADAIDIWEQESSVPMSMRRVPCAGCAAEVRSEKLKSEIPFTFARFYFWVSDIDEANWDPSFKATVEKVLGNCVEYREWST